jgi:hypothetical protein
MTDDQRYVLDLFAGLKGFSQAFEEADNWTVISLDITDEYDVDDGDSTTTVTVDHDYLCDIRAVSARDFDHTFDLILASPPCTTYSLAAISDHRPDDGPNSPKAVDADSIIRHLYNLIKELDPQWWFVENPRAALRTLPPFGEPEGTISWCQYGADVAVMKPTDLWGRHPASFEYRFCERGADCHDAAPRGSTTGTQGATTSATRAKIPAGLSEAVLEAVEHPGETTVQTTLQPTQQTVYPEPTGQQAWCPVCLSEADGWRCDCGTWLIEETRQPWPVCQRCKRLSGVDDGLCAVCHPDRAGAPYDDWYDPVCSCADDPSHVVEYRGTTYFVPEGYVERDIPIEQETRYEDDRLLVDSIAVLAYQCQECAAIKRPARTVVDTSPVTADTAPMAAPQQHATD